MTSLFNHNVFYSQNGMVASSHPLASTVGMEILQKGGSAADAAIAASAVLGFLKPYACGPGGDMVAFIWNHTEKEPFLINGLSKVPLNLSSDRLRKRGLEEVPQNGALPLGIPGTIKGWKILHDIAGILPLSDILTPSIIYSEEGFPVSKETALEWKPFEEKLMLWDASSKIFLRGDRTPNEGELFRNPYLSDLYKTFIEKGFDSFYQGDICKTILELSSIHNGFLLETDFKEYEKGSAFSLKGILPQTNTEAIHLHFGNKNTSLYPHDCSGTALTVIDKNRNAVVLCQSMYSHFGSGLVLEKYGFALGNPMAKMKVSDLSFPDNTIPFPWRLSLIANQYYLAGIGTYYKGSSQCFHHDLPEEYIQKDVSIGISADVLIDNIVDSESLLKMNQFLQISPATQSLIKGTILSEKEMSVVVA